MKQKLINYNDWVLIQVFTKKFQVQLANKFVEECYICIKDNKVFGVYPEWKYSLEDIKEDLKEFDEESFVIYAPTKKDLKGYLKQRFKEE